MTRLGLGPRSPKLNWTEDLMFSSWGQSVVSRWLQLLFNPSRLCCWHAFSGKPSWISSEFSSHSPSTIPHAGLQVTQLPSPASAANFPGLTTEVLRPEVTGSLISLHVFSFVWQLGIPLIMVSGSVAIFTSVSPLAHADELTSHMKANTAVARKS